MLTVADTLIAALSRADSEPVWLVRIEASTTQVYTFTSAVYVGTGYHGAGNDVLTYDGHYPSIVDVVPVGAEVDPLSREYTAGALEVIVLDDGAARTMISSYRLKGKPVHLYLGAIGVAEQDWLPCGSFVFDDHETNEGQISIHAVDPTSVILDAKVRPDDWLRKHPLEIALNVLVEAKVPFALYDAGSFSPQLYDDSISHWCVKDDSNPGRGDARGGTRNADPEQSTEWRSINAAIGLVQTIARSWGDPLAAKDVLSELAAAMGGTVLPDEGKIRFKLYDDGADVARDLTADDMVETPKVIGITHNITNRVTVTYGPSGDRKLVLEDAASAAAHAFPGESERWYDAEIKCAWANGNAQLDTSISSSDTTLYSKDAGLQAFCGTRWDLGSWQPSNGAAAMPPQQAEYQLNQFDRVAYFLIEALGPSSGVEIVKATAFAADATLNGWWNGTHNVRGGTFTIARAQLGTTAVAHQAGARVFDITIPVAMATARLSRYAYGCPEIEVRLPARHVDLQVTDFVTIPDDVVCWYGRTEIDTTTVWEIVRKDADLGDSAGVKLKLLVSQDTPMLPGGSLTYTVPEDSDRKLGEVDRLGNDRVYGNVHVVSGFEGSDSGAGLEASISSGVTASTSSRWERKDADRIAVKPTRDTYFYAEPGTKSFVMIDVVNGDDPPSTPTGCVALFYVETDATSILNITDLREFYALDGGHLDATTIDADTIPEAALPGSGSKGMGVMFSQRKAFTAGGAGVADDVEVRLVLPIGVRVVHSMLLITTAVGGSTAQLRTATGGGGTALSDAFDTATTGRKQDTSTTSPPAVASGGSIYLRRSDRAIAGTAILFLEKT